MAKDSGTESAETSVTEGDAVEEKKNKTPSKKKPVAEQPESTEPEAVEEPVPEETPVVEEPVPEETVAEQEAAAEEAPAAAEAEAEPEEKPAPAVSGPKQKHKRPPRALRHKHSKPARDKPAERKPITRTPKPEGELGRRQERRGVVVSDKGDKTIVVKVEMVKAHPKYQKVVRQSRKLHAHDEQNSAGIGDVVRIIETRPLSKTKHWRLAEIVEKAK
jgi:small subunit ribosomal protein S17